MEKMENNIPAAETTAPVAANKEPMEKPERSLCIGPMVCAAQSNQGVYHIQHKILCQDSSGCMAVPEKGLLLMASADGVSACRRSDIGSKAAVTAALNYLKGQLPTLPDDAKVRDRKLVAELLPAAFQAARDCVEDLSENLNCLTFDLMSTLDVAVYDGSNLWYAHCGDGGIVALDQAGTYRMVTKRHKGRDGDDTSSHVVPLQGDTNEYEFGKVENVLAAALCTDGVLDSYVAKMALHNRVYSPFIAQLLEPAQKGHEALLEQIDGALADPKYANSNNDDLTLVLAANTDALKTAVLPAFDQEAWNRETMKFIEQQKKKLYSQPAAPVGPVAGRPARHAAAPAVAKTRPAPEAVPQYRCAASPAGTARGQSLQDDRTWQVVQAAGLRVRGALRDLSILMVDLMEDSLYSVEMEYEQVCPNCGARIRISADRAARYCPNCAHQLR